MLVDSVLVPIIAIGSLLIGDALGVSSGIGKVMLLVIPVFLLEPGMVAFTGGTVGHHLYKIRVTRMSGVGNINILAATLRFIAKTALGWLSLIFVLVTSKHQSIHDLAARSLVVHCDATTLPSYEVLVERTIENESYEYPSAWRRVAMIICYFIAATALLSASSSVVISSSCVAVTRCSTVEALSAIILNVGWIIGVGYIVVAGWNGNLYGCRKHLRQNPVV